MRPPIALLALLAGCLLATPAQAATYTVNVGGDPAPDGSCGPPDCSLREAVIAANGSAEPDTILLGGQTVTLSITGADEDNAATGDLDVKGTSTLTISGGTITAVEAFGDRILHQLSGALSLTQMTITGGSIPDHPSAATRGGGVYVDGGSSFVMSASRVHGNRAEGGSGGGLALDASTATSEIQGSVIEDNVAQEGGGLYTYHPVEINHTRIEGNTATNRGGGINNNHKLTLDLVRVTGNAAHSGAGLASHQMQANLIIGSTFDANTAAAGGGAILNQSPLTIRESTFSGNQVLPGGEYGGGAIDHSTGSLLLEGVTFVGNTADRGPTLHTGKDVHAVRVLVVGDCHIYPPAAVFSKGSVETGQTCGFTGPDSKMGATVRLGALTDGFHFAPVHPLLGQSDAIDIGKAHACAGNSSDQTGTVRIAGECDAGSFEAFKTDHQVRLSAPSTVRQGDFFDVELSVRNLGPRGTAGVVASLALPAGVERIAGPCVGERTLSCDFGDVMPGATEKAQFVLRAVSSGAQTLQAGLVSDLAELTPGDETAAATVDVAVPPAPSVAPDQTAPVIMVKLPRKLSRRKLAKSRRLSVIVTSSEACAGKLRAKVASKLLAASRPLSFGSSATTVKLKISGKRGRRLKKAKSIRITATCADQAGNVGTATGKARLSL